MSVRQGRTTRWVVALIRRQVDLESQQPAVKAHLKDIMSSLRTRPGEDRNADPGGNFTYSTPISSFPARKGFIPQCCVLTLFRCLHGRMALVGIAVGPWALDSPHANRTSQPISLGVSLSLAMPRLLFRDPGTRRFPASPAARMQRNIPGDGKNGGWDMLVGLSLAVWVCSSCFWPFYCAITVFRIPDSPSLPYPISHLPSPISHSPPGYLSVSLYTNLDNTTQTQIKSESIQQIYSASIQHLFRPPPSRGLQKWFLTGLQPVLNKARGSTSSPVFLPLSSSSLSLSLSLHPSSILFHLFPSLFHLSSACFRLAGPFCIVSFSWKPTCLTLPDDLPASSLPVVSSPVQGAFCCFIHCTVLSQ